MAVVQWLSLASDPKWWISLLFQTKGSCWELPADVQRSGVWFGNNTKSLWECKCWQQQQQQTCPRRKKEQSAHDAHRSCSPKPQWSQCLTPCFAIRPLITNPPNRNLLNPARKIQKGNWAWDSQGQRTYVFLMHEASYVRVEFVEMCFGNSESLWDDYSTYPGLSRIRVSNWQCGLRVC